jgi:hypothetical protein
MPPTLRRSAGLLSQVLVLAIAQGSALYTQWGWLHMISNLAMVCAAPTPSIRHGAYWATSMRIPHGRNFYREQTYIGQSGWQHMPGGWKLSKIFRWPNGRTKAINQTRGCMVFISRSAWFWREVAKVDLSDSGWTSVDTQQTIQV